MERMRRTIGLLLAGAASLALVLTGGGISDAATPSVRTAAAGAAATNGSAHVGFATNFKRAWKPYGNCGVPVSQLATVNYAALNRQNSSGGTGLYDGGKNCGRIIHVVIKRKCAGVGNGGGLNAGFCKGGTLVNDRYTGAALNFVVADSCPDNNGWCRQDPNHLDLAKAALARFVKNGVKQTQLGIGGNWNNREVSWRFVSSSNYKGDIHIGFQKDAQRYYSPVLLTHLRNGIHRVQFLQGGTWKDATLRGDEGQAFQIGPTTDGGTRYKIRAWDALDRAIQHGRTYSFGFPTKCGSKCTAAYTAVHVTTG
jgi:hypothetical protein